MWKHSVKKLYKKVFDGMGNYGVLNREVSEIQEITAALRVHKCG
jgi:hypothetical protein